MEAYHSGCQKPQGRIGLYDGRYYGGEEAREGHEYAIQDETNIPLIGHDRDVKIGGAARTNLKLEKEK